MCIHGYTKQNMFFYELQDVFMYEMYLYSRFRWNVLVHIERIYNGRWDEIMLPRVKTAFQGGFNRTDTQEVIRKPSSSSSLIYHLNGLVGGIKCTFRGRSVIIIKLLDT